MKMILSLALLVLPLAAHADITHFDVGLFKAVSFALLAAKGLDQ